MLVPPTLRTAPSILEARVEALESVVGRLLLELVERPRQRTAPSTSRLPKAQRRAANMQQVGALRLEHPDWSMWRIAEKCELKVDYCNQLWREYRAEHAINAVRARG